MGVLDQADVEYGAYERMRMAPETTYIAIAKPGTACWTCRRAKRKALQCR